jgi:general secretion pathway protein N
MLKLAALGIVAFIVSLVITAPARVAGDYLPPDIRAIGLEGTLWEGQAHRLEVRGFDLGEVSWDVHPLALLVGRLQSRVSINHADLQGQGTVNLGFNSMGLVDTRATGNSRLLAPYLSDYGVNVDGRFELNAQTMRFNDRGPQAMDGVLVWQDARITSPAALALGDVSAVLTQEGEAAVAELSNNGDELRLSGSARLEADWKYNARLRLAPTPSTPKEIRDTLPFLGQPDAKGAVTVNQQGTLKPQVAGEGNAQRNIPAKARRR